MVQFKEANARLFQNKYVCKKCKSVRRAPFMKVLAGLIKCRKCNSKYLRVKRKK